MPYVMDPLQQIIQIIKYEIIQIYSLLTTPTVRQVEFAV
jgi:hypothetical protein